jgi:hypothetical protein
METTIQATKPFSSKEQYFEYRAIFKKLAHEKRLTANDMILNNILRGRKPDFGFTPITKQSKIDNGLQSKFVYARWSIWNNLRNAYQYKKDVYFTYIHHYEEYKKVLTPEIWKYVFDVLQA